MAKLLELMKLKEQFKDKTLREYVNEHLFKKRELLPLDQEAYEIFCQNFSTSVRHISTGSHMAFLQWEEAFGLGEDLLVNLPTLLDKKESNIIFTPCSRINFQSVLTRPGSVDLSNMGGKNVKLSRLVLRGRSKITLNKAAKIRPEEMKHFLRLFEKIKHNHTMFPFIKQKQLGLFIEHAKKMIQEGETFNEQCSWLSSTLWPHLFNNMDVKPLTIKPLEDLKVKRENILLNKKFRELLELHFKDTYGALSSTYFYYGSCKCGIEFPLQKIEVNGRLFLEGNCLDRGCSYFGIEKYRVDLKDIISEIEKKNLNETLFITFYNIWAVAGIDVLGGFNQADYLTEFRDKLCIIFTEMGQTNKSEILRKRATNLFDLGFLPLFNKNGTPKTGLQLLLEGGISQNDIEIFSQVNFAKAVEVSLQTIQSIFGDKPDHSRTITMLKQNSMELLIR